MNNSLIHSTDLQMQEILKIAESVAASRATILIQGESGTGKELLARFIHAKSNRAQSRFLALNCAAVPENLLESELFGYEKGAFTGADQRKIGKFELANQSTFLLDEIGELPLALQAKILRVIQEGEVERLGGSHPIKVNVRLIAATNKNLSELVKNGQFREDLFYRLNVIPLEIPALRERPKDIAFLSRLFLETSCNQNGFPIKSLTKESEDKLLSWDWPGNIRELQNVIERSVLLTKNTQLSANDILITNYVPQKIKSLNAGMTVSEAEKILILNTLDHTNQNRTQAAQLLGISIRTLRNKINEYKVGSSL